jgi:tetratricopeptide (TPR) repeat protein
MKMPQISFLVCLLALSMIQNAIANSKKEEAKLIKGTVKQSAQQAPKLIVRKEMNIISGHIRDLGPFIASEQEFTRESNKAIIEKHLQELTMSFKNIKVHPVINTEGLSINRAVLVDQLEQTMNLFTQNKKSWARAKFNAALNLCVSCHTQTPGTVQKGAFKVFADKDISKLKLNDFERAELYFITRDFEGAIKLYDKFLLSSKKTDDDEYIYKAFERELIYFIKFKKSFPLAKAHFENLLKANRFNDKVAQEVGDWIKILGGKSLWDQFDPQKVKEEDMEKFMNTFIADDEEGPIFTATNSSEVYDLNLSSILMDYYNAHPETKFGAKILYWLAALDKRVNDDLFFSLGGYYLITCMEKYPKDPVAHDCYESYIDDLEMNYMSKEKKWPAEIEARLKKLQTLIHYKESDEE